MYKSPITKSLRRHTAIDSVSMQLFMKLFHWGQHRCGMKRSLLKIEHGLIGTKCTLNIYAIAVAVELKVRMDTHTHQWTEKNNNLSFTVIPLNWHSWCPESYSHLIRFSILIECLSVCLCQLKALIMDPSSLSADAEEVWVKMTLFILQHNIILLLP